MKNLRPKKKSLDNYAKYSSIGLQMLVIILAGAWGGTRLDRLTHWKFPLFTLVLSLTAVIFAIYVAIKDFIKK